ncbi:MAG: bifunctional adenosylcobinamide kinase/adenosylcobinamide-phosphate guanylyltransferase [Proteobacteria bacterium]|nr:bifunctional adenosylcobinamide kinase/adenosylcobinamide-phosphate guanylyltransferase [Pseudomonadota bacterium]
MNVEGNLPAVTLVLGGARSGKSTFAEQCVEAMPARHIYIATGQAGDEEMAERIRRHQTRRGSNWRTVEEPLDLTGALERNAKDGAAVLVDCLTLWLSNLMMAKAPVKEAIGSLVDVLARGQGTIVLVSNEVGQGIVPANSVAREFRDHAGWMNQQIAAIADSVVLVTAGIPQHLKSPKGV